MSVIAWDGERLAADKRATLGTLIRTTTKVFHLGDALAAYAGDADAVEGYECGSCPWRCSEFTMSYRARSILLLGSQR